MKIKILIFLLAFTISYDTYACHEEDYIALRALYLSTEGDNWNNNAGWLTAAEFMDNENIPAGTDVKTWYGVTINTEGCVTKLNLRDNQLSGSIPSEIGNLSNLTDLILRDNQLSGSIPNTIGNLSDLEGLYLNDNVLSANIPSEIGNLNNLVDLYLYNNQLSGSIPSEIGNLSNLSELRLSYNQLNGSIPNTIGNLDNLDYLDLGNNELSGSIPSEIGNLSNLTDLSLRENQLSGNIPSEISNLSSVQALYLNNNQLTGSIPAKISNLNNLTILYLYQNMLNGCYDIALLSLCAQLDGSSNTNGKISSGNNFDAPWEYFCANGDCLVDIDNTQQSIFTVYPIPAKDVVVFDVPNIAVADEIILYDITGKQISRQAFPQDKQLAVSHLNKGVYIYRIFYENEVYSGKIVVE